MSIIKWCNMLECYFDGKLVLSTLGHIEKASSRFLLSLSSQKERKT